MLERQVSWHELTVPFLKALGEIRRVHAVLLHDFTRFQLDLSQCRLAVTGRYL